MFILRHSRRLVATSYKRVKPPSACVLARAHSMPVQMSTAFTHSVQQRLEDVLATPEASSIIAEKKATSLCQYYETLISTDKARMLCTLARDYGVDQQAVMQHANLLLSVDSQEREVATVLRAEERVRTALTPRYQQLFTHISRLEHGVKFLVDLRADLLQILSSGGLEQDSPYLQAMSNNLRSLLSLWFSVGFLQLERITWQSPCDILQKISDYEAVHPIRNWTDLRRRVGAHRRCYVFTHGSMPREPVVVLHIALTSQISDSIQAIVQNSSQLANGSDAEQGTLSKPAEESGQPNTAIFYSITSTQKGLQGVELGNYLIKNAVKELLVEFPHMSQFSSLSPIPGFRDWLLGQINRTLHRKDIGESDQENKLFTDAEYSSMRQGLELGEKDFVLPELKKVLSNNSWHRNTALCSCLRAPLMRLCARYLYLEKRRHFAFNPVANFHLRNGAVMWRINWLADTSPRGLGASCALMVNYRYYLEHTEEYSKQYTEQHVIQASSQVLDLLQDTHKTDSTPESTNKGIVTERQGSSDSSHS